MNDPKEKSMSGLTASTSDTLSSGVLKLLKNTVLGTPGKLRYQHTEVEERIQSLNNIQFIEIKKRSRVLGTAAIVNRSISMNHSSLEALYVRYLSVYVPNRSAKNQNPAVNPKTNRRSKIRNEISNIFTSELEKPFQETKQAGLFYAYVENDNILSKNLCSSFGFESIRTILTLLFSRFSPKSNSNVSELDANDLADFRSDVQEFYTDHDFVYTDDLEDLGVCFTYKLNGQSLAGLRAIPIKWKIVEIPGLKGFVMQKILPKIPFFNRIFNPDKLEFLAFDSLWYKDNHHEYIEKVMEHACAKYGINMGMTWGDESSKVTKRLLKTNKLGFLHKINGKVKAMLMIRPVNMDKGAIPSNNPAYVSAVDMT